jgi:DNA-directed RNA polymerase subunit RPC12/RpoP
MKKEKSFPIVIPRRMQFACIDCRKAFKQQIAELASRRKETVCPQCGSKMWEMGRNFKAPKQSDVKQWRKVEALVTNGITFHSNGSHGLGRFPQTIGEVKPFLERVRKKSDGEKLLAGITKRTTGQG